jgi:hypothetical protein
VARQQAPFSFEVIVSLNSADPEPRRALETMLAPLTDLRFRIVPSYVRGAAHTRNVGAAASTGPAIRLADGDFSFPVKDLDQKTAVFLCSS